MFFNQIRWMCFGFSLGAMLLGFPATADSARGKQFQSVSIEAFGRSGSFSWNYDRAFNERWLLGGGMGVISASNFSAWGRAAPSIKSASGLSFLGYFNYYGPGEYLTPYLTAGASLALSDKASEVYLWPGVGIEFRFHEGPLFRGTFYLGTPATLDNFFLWFGLSAGWCFP